MEDKCTCARIEQHFKHIISNLPFIQHTINDKENSNCGSLDKFNPTIIIREGKQ